MMQFKDLNNGDVFIKQGKSAEYTKVPEQRISCCKVKCNAKRNTDNAEIVFRPLDEVVKVENK